MSFDMYKVDVVDMLEALKVRDVEVIGPEVKFSCPFGNHSQGGAAYMNVESTAWMCHGCKRRGNAVSFLAALENISPMLAARYIRERYQTDFREPGGGLLEEFEGMLSHTPTPEAEEYVHEHNPYEINWHLQPQNPSALYMYDRGFKWETLEAWGIGYDVYTDRITIPITNVEGDIVGFKARAWRPDQKPKYLMLGDAPGREPRFGYPTAQKSRYVFGMDWSFSYEYAVIVEGELNAIMLYQHVNEHERDWVPVALNGSDVSELQLRELKEFNSAVLFLDDDPSGHTGTAKLVDLLTPYIMVFIVGPHDGDPCDLTSDQCVTLIDDARSANELWIPDDSSEGHRRE